MRQTQKQINDVLLEKLDQLHELRRKLADQTDKLEQTVLAAEEWWLRGDVFSRSDYACPALWLIFLSVDLRGNGQSAPDPPGSGRSNVLQLYPRSLYKITQRPIGVDHVRSEVHATHPSVPTTWCGRYSPCLPSCCTRCDAKPDHRFSPMGPASGRARQPYVLYGATECSHARCSVPSVSTAVFHATHVQHCRRFIFFLQRQIRLADANVLGLCCDQAHDLELVGRLPMSDTRL